MLEVELQDFLKAIASETRQRILMVMLDGQEHTVGQIAQTAGIGMSTASEHLSVMRRGHLVQVRRVGVEALYKLDKEKIVSKLQELTTLLTCC